MPRHSVSALAVLFAAACGWVSPEPGAEEPEGAATPPSVAHCEPIRAQSLEALCAAWERARRSELPGMRDVRCAREQYNEPVTRAAHTLTILDTLYSVEGRSHGERYVVLSDGDGWQVVGRVNEIFEEPADGFIGLQRRELREPHGGAPVVVLEGVTREREDSPCIYHETHRRKIVLCGELSGGYRCFVETIEETVTSGISGGAHPVSSQYNSETAGDCRAALAEAGLNGDTDRRETSRETRTTHFVSPGVVRFEPGGEVRLSGRTASANCATAF